MDIYSVHADSDHYAWLPIINRGQSEMLERQPQGMPFDANLEPLQVDLLAEDDEGYIGNLPWGDFIALGPATFALNENAVSLVGDAFLSSGQLLPVSRRDSTKQLSWFHCTTVLDAIDQERTIAKRFDDGRLYMIERHWFYADPLRDAMFFKVPQSKTMIFCTDTARDRIVQAQLTGLVLHLRWSDEPEGREKIAAWEKRVYKGCLPPLPSAWPRHK